MSIWAALATIAEATATSNIGHELKRVLGHLVEQEKILEACARYDAFMNVQTNDIRLQAQQHMFSDKNLNSQQIYQLVRYKIDHFQVDFRNVNDAVCVINGFVNFSTDGLVPKLVNWYELSDVKVLMTSTVQFSGKWRVNFMFDL